MSRAGRTRGQPDRTSTSQPSCSFASRPSASCCEGSPRLEHSALRNEALGDIAPQGDEHAVRRSRSRRRAEADSRSRHKARRSHSRKPGAAEAHPKPGAAEAHPKPGAGLQRTCSRRPSGLRPGSAPAARADHNQGPTVRPDTGRQAAGVGSGWSAGPLPPTPARSTRRRYPPYGGYGYGPYRGYGYDPYDDYYARSDRAGDDASRGASDSRPRRSARRAWLQRFEPVGGEARRDDGGAPDAC